MASAIASSAFRFCVYVVHVAVVISITMDTLTKYICSVARELGYLNVKHKHLWLNPELCGWIIIIFKGYYVLAAGTSPGQA